MIEFRAQTCKSQIYLDSIIIFPENDDKKGNTPLVTSPSTENVSRFSFFRRNKTQAKTQEQSTEDEGNMIFVL